MSKKLKAIESEILPNHKEAEIWVTPTNEDGSKEIKYWNRKTDSWENELGNNGSECGVKPIAFYFGDSYFAALEGMTFRQLLATDWHRPFPYIDDDGYFYGEDRYGEISYVYISGDTTTKVNIDDVILDHVMYVYRR